MNNTKFHTHLRCVHSGHVQQGFPIVIFLRAKNGRRQFKDNGWRPNDHNCPTMYLGADKGPNKYGLRARFDPQAAIWEGLMYSVAALTLEMSFLPKSGRCRHWFQLGISSSWWIPKTLLFVLGMRISFNRFAGPMRCGTMFHWKTKHGLGQSLIV